MWEFFQNQQFVELFCLLFFKNWTPIHTVYCSVSRPIPSCLMFILNASTMLCFWSQSPFPYTCPLARQERSWSGPGQGPALRWLALLSRRCLLSQLQQQKLKTWLSITSFTRNFHGSVKCIKVKSHYELLFYFHFHASLSLSNYHFHFSNVLNKKSWRRVSIH